MYYVTVPLFYRLMSCYFGLPKVPPEELFSNMVRNMNSATHQYRGVVPFVMTVVSFAGNIAMSY